MRLSFVEVNRVLLVTVTALLSVFRLSLGAQETELVRFSRDTGSLRIAVAGMVHGHVEGLLHAAGQRDDLQIVGVYEPNRELYRRLAEKYDLDSSLRYDSLDRMLEGAKPEVVSGMTSIRDHVQIVEACAPRGVHVFLEKPLAYSLADARRMAELAKKHRTLVLTNYETSWYESVREAERILMTKDAPAIRRMVFRHGHSGPREIGCAPEFLEWLTDPEENGGGALVDFGCYGVVLASWLMKGERPLEIQASAHQTKPETYLEVDDDSTIILRYPGVVAVVQGSWAWTHDLKEMDVYTDSFSLHAGRWDLLTKRVANGEPERLNPQPMLDVLRDEWTYLKEVVRGKTAVDELSSLELNLTVVSILDEARRQVASSL